MSKNYRHLLSPGSIGGLELRNRIVLAAMGSNFAAQDGHCTERLIAYYEARAKGGPCLLVLETSAACFPNGSTMPNTVAFSRDEFIPVPSPIQPGSSDMFNVLTPDEIGHFIKAAGPDGKGPTYYEMTPQHIADTIVQFAAAAERAQRAGFDGVEIHAGHGYLLANFLSPYTNKRTDQYGGSLQNRARFLLEVIAAMREATAGDFPILVRLDAKEYRIEGGIEPADCCCRSAVHTALNPFWFMKAER